MDHSGETPVRVFESGAILQYLAEKFGAFLPASGAARAECLSWLFWQMGSAPFLGGGFGHFYAYAPAKFEYPINRFAMEIKRQLDVLDRRLAESHYLAGDDYTIADMAVWPWYGTLVKGQLYEAGEFLRCTTTRTCCVGPMKSPSARPCSAAARSTAPGASRPANCMSATRPATSTPRPKTSCRPRRSRGLDMITLYDCATAPSPRRARIFLAEKGVAHETVQVDLRTASRWATLTARSTRSAPCPRCAPTTARC